MPPAQDATRPSLSRRSSRRLTGHLVGDDDPAAPEPHEILDNSGERASDGAHHVGKRAAGSRFKLTGLRIGSEAATEEGGPRETPAALKTLQQDLLGCDNQTRAFLAGV